MERRLIEGVFPTHVGVFPQPRCFPQDSGGLPHARGGVSGGGTRPDTPLGLPHARGGVSQDTNAVAWYAWSSPRTWGCFLQALSQKTACPVFPTHVGVFLTLMTRRGMWECLPHARGGVSGRFEKDIPSKKSSPRTWGCFYRPRVGPKPTRVFPTHVGVFLLCFFIQATHGRLPHARGGVSTGAPIIYVGIWSSPRTWGCFWTGSAGSLLTAVFPTHVGVFLSFNRRLRILCRLPHARGGVSI